MIHNRNELPALHWVQVEKQPYPNEGELVVARRSNGIIVTGYFWKDAKTAPYGKVGNVSWRAITDYVVIDKPIYI